MPKFVAVQIATRRGGNSKDVVSPKKTAMLAAQALKQRRALEEDLERHHHGHEHREHGAENEKFDGEEGESEGEDLIELPKYLQGIPLVDKHSEVEGTYVVIAKNLAGILQVSRFTASKSCYLFGPRNKIRKFTSYVITHRLFELIILITILTNCIFLALNNPPTESEIVFAVIYTTEMFLKIVAKGFIFPKFAYLRNSWNWLDFVCVIVGYLTFHPVVANFSVVRTFRVLRALRTISAVKGLKAMVNTLMKSIKMLSDVMILTTFFICVFALIGLQLFKGTLHNKCVKDMPDNVTEKFWKDFVNNESNWIINNDFPFVCGNGTYSGHCPTNYTCLKEIGENPPKANIPFISFDNFLWSLLTSLQLVTLDSWEIVYNVVIGANGQVYVLYFLFVVLLGPFYLINLVLAVVSLSYEIESQALDDEDLKAANYLGLQRSASSYDFDRKEMPEPLYLDDTTQRPEETKYEPENARPPSRTPTPSSNNALELGETYDQENERPAGCCVNCRSRINRMVDSPYFEGFITTCILLNTLCMALEYHGMDPTFKKVLDMCNLVFTVVFILEMILKLVALGFRQYTKAAWNVFDGVIVIMSIVDMSMEYSNAGGAGGVLSVLRTFRLLRVLKLAKSWKTMGDLLATIGKSVGAVGNITIILLILMFIFAVVGMQLFRDAYNEDKFPHEIPRWNFKDFPRSFMMVFRIICGKWIEPCWDVMYASGEPAFIYILMVFILGQWIVLNLFLALLLSSFSDDDSVAEENKEEKKEKKKKKKFSLLRFFKKKKKGRVTPNNSKEDLEDAIKKDDMNENPDLTMVNGKGGDPGNCVSTRAASGESARSEVESIKHGTVDGDPSQASFPVSVVVDETKENHLKSNKDSPLEHVNNNSTEQLNVANGGGHGMPNGNSHKGSSMDIKRSSSDMSQSSLALDGERRDSAQDSIGTGTLARNSSIRGSRRPTMMIQGEDGQPVAPECYPAFCYKDGICSICSPSFKASKIRKLWTSMRTKINLFVEHKYFESFILFLIIVSSLSLAFEDVYLKDRPTLEKILQYSNYFFAVIFGLEFLLKLVGYGVVGYFTSFWNLLDVFIVAISVATLTGNENLNALRSLRALRPLRAVSKFEGMKIVINSLVLSIPAIANVVLVCMIFWLIFSIMGYQFFGGKFFKCIDIETRQRLPETIVNNRSQCENNTARYRWVNAKVNYDDAFSGFLALFQVATLEGYMEVIFDSVDAVDIDMQPRRNYNYAINIFYVIFITMGSFFILNLFIGVIIENFSRLKQQYEDNDAMGMFLTPSQRIWVNTVCRTYMKRPKKQPKRPEAEWRGKIYDLIQSRSFEFFIMTIIILNIITMMAEHHNQSDEFTEALDIFNLIFTTLFIIEAILRLLALRSEYFKSGWNLFDFTIVLFSITEIVLDSYHIEMPFSPGLLRVVRVFRLARLLRFFEGAKGIRSLLFALVKSLPGLANIGCLLFLFMFIYACIGMSLWGNVRHTGYLDPVVNFSTFFSSLLLLFRIATAAGWNTILEPMMVRPPDCDPDYGGLPNGDCGTPWLAVVYFVSYILLIFLVTVNMYIAVILENFNEAQQQDEIGLCEEDMDAFISTWETFDSKASQFIHYRDLTHFLDVLDPPLRIPKPNEDEFASMDVPVRQGDMVHCLDLMLALVKRVIGDNEDLTDTDKENMFEKFEDRFQSTFPQRRVTPKLYTILQRYKQETAAAIRLQRAFRDWQVKVQGKKDKFHKYSTDEKAQKDDIWQEKQLANESRPGSAASNRPRTSPRKRAPLAKQETIDSPLPQAKKPQASPTEEQMNTNGVRETAENFKNDPSVAEAMNMMWYTSRGGNGNKSESAV